MARQAPSKPDSGSASATTSGFVADFHGWGIRISNFVIPTIWSQHFIPGIRRTLGEGEHLTPQTSFCGRAFQQCEALPQVVSKVKYIMVVPPCWIANGLAGAGFSNQSGNCSALSSTSMPKATPQSLPRQRDPAIRDRALFEADLVDNMAALPARLFRSNMERLSRN
jgi:hypothetical protein